jgi:hypothetical protein
MRHGIVVGDGGWCVGTAGTDGVASFIFRSVNRARKLG